MFPEIALADADVMVSVPVAKSAFVPHCASEVTNMAETPSEGMGYVPEAAGVTDVLKLTPNTCELALLYGTAHAPA